MNGSASVFHCHLILKHIDKKNILGLKCLPMKHNFRFFGFFVVFVHCASKIVMKNTKQVSRYKLTNTIFKIMGHMSSKANLKLITKKIYIFAC